MSLITNEQAAYLLCSAFEGGSSYWYLITGYNEPTEVATPFGEGEYTPKYVAYPFSNQGAVFVVDSEDSEGEKYTLDSKAVARGKKLMEQPDFKDYLSDVLAENDDAETGDVFLQLCLFGEVVYG